MKASKKAPKRRSDDTTQRGSKKAKVSHDCSEEISDRLGYTFLLGVGPDFVARPNLQVTSLNFSNLPKDDVQAAYTKGSEIVGFDFQAATNENTTACVLRASHVDALMRHGLPLIPEAKGADVGAQGEDFELTVSSYINIWLLIAKLGDKDLEWEVIDPWFKDFDLLAVGGRSLFKLGTTPFRSKFLK